MDTHIGFSGKIGIYLLLAFLLALSAATKVGAETATVRDDCGTLTMISHESPAGGEYEIDLQGSIPASNYYVASVSVDNSTIPSYTYSSFWDNSFSAVIGPFSVEHLFRLEMKGGTSHGICMTSLELTAGGAGKDPGALAKNICSELSDLDGGAFKNSPDQRKKALCNKLDEVAIIADYAANAQDPVVQDQLYLDAIEKVKNDIASKLDGDNGGSANNDWIVGRDSRSRMFPMVEQLINVLKNLI